MAFEEVRYLAEGIREEDLDLLASLPGIVRTKDVAEESAVDLSNEAQVRALLATEPQVLERPVLVRDGSAVIGRPPELILALLDA